MRGDPADTAFAVHAQQSAVPRPFVAGRVHSDRRHRAAATGEFCGIHRRSSIRVLAQRWSTVCGCRALVWEWSRGCGATSAVTRYCNSPGLGAALLSRGLGLRLLPARTSRSRSVNGGGSLAGPTAAGVRAPPHCSASAGAPRTDSHIFAAEAMRVRLTSRCGISRPHVSTVSAPRPGEIAVVHY